MCMFIRSMYNEVHHTDQPGWDALHYMTALESVPSEVIIYWLMHTCSFLSLTCQQTRYISTAKLAWLLLSWIPDWSPVLKYVVKCHYLATWLGRMPVLCSAKYSRYQTNFQATKMVARHGQGRRLLNSGDHISNNKFATHMGTKWLLMWYSNLIVRKLQVMTARSNSSIATETVYGQQDNTTQWKGH